MPILWHLASNLCSLFCFLAYFIHTSTRLLHYSLETTLAKVTQDLLSATFIGYINLWIPLPLNFSFHWFPCLHGFLACPPLQWLSYSLLLIFSSTISSKLVVPEFWFISTPPTTHLTFMLSSSSLPKASIILITPTLHFQLSFLTWALVLYL